MSLKALNVNKDIILTGSTTNLLLMGATSNYYYTIHFEFYIQHPYKVNTSDIWELLTGKHLLDGYYYIYTLLTYFGESPTRLPNTFKFYELFLQHNSFADLIIKKTYVDVFDHHVVCV